MGCEASIWSTNGGVGTAGGTTFHKNVLCILPESLHSESGCRNICHCMALLHGKRKPICHHLWHFLNHGKGKTHMSLWMCQEPVKKAFVHAGIGGASFALRSVSGIEL